MRGRVSLLLFVGTFVAACSSRASHAAHSDATSTSRAASTASGFVFDRARAQQNLETLVEKSAGATGGVLAISIHGAPPTILTTGTWPNGSTRAVAATDAFHIASVTKTFVGALVLRLADRGLVHLDDPINRYGLGWPHGDTITVRMLLDHTSGIAPLGSDAGFAGPYADDFAGFLAQRAGRVISVDEVLTYAAPRPLEAPPGTRTVYSNVDTILAARIAETVTHEPLAGALRRELLDPLHLASTHDAPDAALDAGGTIPLAAGAAERPLLSAIGAAGAMTSNAGDLIAWGNAFLRDGSFLSAASHRLATTILPGGTGAGTVGWGEPVGMCVFTPQGCPARGVRFFAYGGSGNIPGAQTILLYDHDNDTTIAAFVNGDGAPVSVLAPLTWFDRAYRG